MKRSLRAAFRSFVICGGAPVVLGACTMVGGGAGVAPPPESVLPAAAAAPAPPTTPGASAGQDDTARLTAQVVEVALDAIGTPYEWGGTDSNGFDCSGLIRFAYGRVGVRLPRTSADQLRAGAPVALAPELLRPGDILGFSGDDFGKPSHVGLFIGGGEFIHSGSSGVRISTLRNPYWRDRLVAARRPIA